MKKPRIADFDPATAERELGSPLDDMPAILSPKDRRINGSRVAGLPANLQAGKPVNMQTNKQANLQAGLPAKMQTSLPANGQAGKQVTVEKYSTYLRPDYKKELKLLALEADKKDYEILEEAVALYLQTCKPANQQTSKPAYKYARIHVKP